MKAYISLGSNQGDRFALLCRGLALLRKRGYGLCGVSKIYQTPPWGKEDQDAFLNAVACLDCPSESPDRLMDELLAVERECGRVRTVKWGPRTLDLDILFIPGLTQKTDHVKVPHPYVWERAFVLVPLADIAPELVHNGQSVTERLSELDREGIVSVKTAEEFRDGVEGK